ncbi:MAG: hypothetical protein KQH63_16045 [Desulfobulbaceae bacterium]|nr:hypothetical protein [Desulfobulbaceae bacterium]
MTTTTQKTTVAHEKESISQSGAQVGIGIIAILSAMIGMWGLACLAGGLSQYGIVGLVKGWISAVMGI